MKRLLGRLCGAVAVLLLLLLQPARALPDPADAIVGDWLVETRDAVIRVSRVADGSYEGHIAWQLRDHYGPEDGAEWNGKVVVDRNNPDPALRGRLLDNLLLIWGLRYQVQEQDWQGGHVYNSDDGQTYRCRVRLNDPDHLRLRGYFGITLLGGSTTWTRVSSFPPRPGAPPPPG